MSENRVAITREVIEDARASLETGIKTDIQLFETKTGMKVQEIGLVTTKISGNRDVIIKIEITIKL